MRKNSSSLFIGAIVVAIAGLVIMNTVQEKNRPKTESEIEKEQEEADKAKQSAKTTTDQGKAEAGNSKPGDPSNAENTGARKPDTMGTSDDLVLQDGRVSLGDPRGKHKMVVAYEWTPDIQNDPTRVTQLLSHLKGIPDTQVTVINTDSATNTADSIIPGLYVDGKLVVDNPFDTSPMKTREVFRHVQNAIR